MTCEVCGVGTREQRRIDKAFEIDGRWVVVEKFPAEVCWHCGEVTIAGDVAEEIRRIVREGKSGRIALEADLYTFASPRGHRENRPT